MFDLLILGGGPAGYHAAEIAAENGLAVALFEGRALGGVCLNEGCIPSKALLYSAKLYDAMKDGKKYGVTCQSPVLDYTYALKRKDKVVRKLVAGIEAKLKARRVELVRERAAITKRIDGGFCVEAGGQVYEGAKLLLCTGSQPVLPPVEGLREALASGFLMTNREMLAMADVPKRMAIIGGGVIGLEMASLMNSAGCAVTVIELLDKIAGPMDSDISALLQKEYEKKGVTFLLGAKLVKVGSDSVTYTCKDETHELPCEKALLSIGRTAATEGLGLEQIGVLTERGAVVTDDQMKTNIPGVFAAGDINGKSMLAHTAYREAEVAVSVMLGKRDAMRYDAIPAVLYTNPEAAGVGETLDSARAKGLDAHESTLPMQYSGRYVAENEGGNGIAKLVWHQNRLIGVHMLGNPCSEIIASAAALISQEMTLERCRKLIFPHPSVSEILHEGFFHTAE